jgi:hypothetical protein
MRVFGLLAPADSIRKIPATKFAIFGVFRV